MTYTNPLDELVARCDLPISVELTDYHWVVRDNNTGNADVILHWLPGDARKCYIDLRTRLMNEAAVRSIGDTMWKLNHG
jgi:hypothetical protein